MTTNEMQLQENATELAACLAQGHHHASLHMARLVEADSAGALNAFAAALGAQIRDYLQETGNPRIQESRLAHLDLALHELMLKTAENWVTPGYRVTAVQPETITCQAIRVNGQTCNAPAAPGSTLCRYHLNHESDR